MASDSLLDVEQKMFSSPIIHDCGKLGFFWTFGLSCLRFLEEGTSATVYLAEAPIDVDEPYRAVKIFPRHGPKSEKFSLSLFKKEISIMNSLDHPNVMSKIIAGVCPAYYAISMKYCPGGDLLDRMERGALPAETLNLYAAELASAVRYLHGVRVYHGDIKPENILLDDKEDILISDFGHAQILPPSSNEIVYFGGTIGYLGPEVGKLGDRDAFKLEAFAVGITMLVMFLNKDVSKIYDYASIMKKPLFNESHFSSFVPNLLKEDPKERWDMITLCSHLKTLPTMSQFKDGLLN